MPNTIIPDLNDQPGNTTTPMPQVATSVAPIVDPVPPDAAFFNIPTFGASELPPEFTFGVGENRRLALTRDSAVFTFYHKAKFLQIPGIENSVLCGPGCVFCALNKAPSIAVSVAGVDLDYGTSGILRGWAEATLVPGSDLKLAPHLRLSPVIKDYTIYKALMVLVFRHPEPVVLSVTKAAEYRFQVLDISASEPLPLDQLVEAAQALKAARGEIADRLGSRFTAQELSQVPTIARVLKTKGIVLP